MFEPLFTEESPNTFLCKIKSPSQLISTTSSDNTDMQHSLLTSQLKHLRRSYVASPTAFLNLGLLYQNTLHFTIVWLALSSFGCYPECVLQMFKIMNYVNPHPGPYLQGHPSIIHFFKELILRCVMDSNHCHSPLMGAFFR